MIFDSATGLLVDGAGVRGFIGVSVFPAEDALPLGARNGPACNGDLDCGTASGHPSWHIAALALHADSWGTTALFLKSGTQGVWQSPAIAMAPDPPTEASAVFGVPNDVVHSWGDSPGPEMRNAHLGEADAVVVVASADFDENGTVDSAGFLTWQRGFGLGDTLADADTDGNAVVNVSHLAAWRFQFRTTLSMKGSSMVVPEPHPALALLAGIVSLGCGRPQPRG